MSLLRIFGLALATLAGFNAPTIAFAQQSEAVQSEIDPVELALAIEIIDEAFPIDNREIMFFGSMDQIMLQTREALGKTDRIKDEGAQVILDQWTEEYTIEAKEIIRRHIPSLMAGMARSYAVIFTRTELEDILAFAKTESGRRYLQLSPAIVAEPNFAQANQAYMDEFLTGLPEAQTELIGRLMEYYGKKLEEEPEADS